MAPSLRRIHTLHFYHRDSFTYTSGWSHLDRQSFAFSGQELGRYIALRDDDGGDECRFKIIIRLTPEQLREAKRNWRRTDRKQSFENWAAVSIANYYSGGCTCEHDCCAHMQYHGRAKRTKQREWIATMTGYRNI